MTRPAAALAPASRRMSAADRILAEYGPTVLLAAEAPHVLGGSTVFGWRDRSGNGNHALTLTGSAPTFSASDSDFAGRPSLSFAAGYLATTTTFTAGDLTVAVVFRDSSVTGSYEALVDFAFADNIAIYRSASSANSWLLGIVEPLSPWGQTVTATDNVRPHMMILRRSGSTHDVWVDGLQAATKTGSGAATTARAMRVGGGTSGGNYTGKMALAAYWNGTALTDNQLRELTRIGRDWWGTAG